MNQQTIVMKRAKECKGSVRYDVPKDKAEESAVTNVYVKRSFITPMPDMVTVTVEAGHGA